MCTPWYVLDLCTKDEGDRAYGLGGVSEHTNTQTHTHAYAINNIDECARKSTIPLIKKIGISIFSEATLH